MPKKLKIVNQEKVFFLTVGTLSVYNEFTDTGNSAVKLFFLYYLHGTKKLKNKKTSKLFSGWLWLAMTSLKVRREETKHAGVLLRASLNPIVSRPRMSLVQQTTLCHITRSSCSL